MRVPCSTCPDPAAACHACDQCEDRRTKCPGKTVPCACCLKRGLRCTRTPRMVRVRKHEAPDCVSEARRKRLRLVDAAWGTEDGQEGPWVVAGPLPPPADTVGPPLVKPPPALAPAGCAGAAAGGGASAASAGEPARDVQAACWPFPDEDSRSSWLDALADAPAPSLRVLDHLLSMQDGACGGLPA